MLAWTIARIAPLAVAGLLGMVALAGADPVSDKVATARAVHEKQMEEVRGRVRSILDREEAQLRRRAKPDEEGLASLAAERAAFETKGQWPSMTLASVRQQQERAWVVLDRAYQDAEGVYARAKKSEQEAAIRAERAELPKEDDLAAWAPDLVGEANRQVEPETALVLGALPAMPYRLEVVARLAAGSGRLIIECPLGGGKRLPVVASPSEAGDLRAMLTVRASLVSADLGVERPVDLERAVADPDGRLTLRSEGAKFLVESVRVKALPSRTPAAPAPVQAPESKADNGQPMPVGSKWRGLFGGQTFDSIQICDATVTARTDDTVEFLLEYEKVQMTWTFRLSGSNLVLTAVTGPDPQRLNVKGSGEISDQTISIDWQWDLRSHAKGEKGTLQLMSYDLLPKPLPPAKPTK